MNKLRENIVLAGLLHDIGKFWQRAEPEAAVKNSRFLRQDTKNIIGDFCPKRKHGYSHLHSAWTYQFLTDFDNYLYQNRLDASQSVINLAACHHNPATLLQEIIQKADWISAGMDRSDCGDVRDEISEEISRKYNFRKQRLQPVFENIYRGEYVTSRATGRPRYRLLPLSLDKATIFPGDFRDENEELSNEYQENLWSGFQEEFKNLPTGDFNVFIESLLPLLRKYTWCIPSSTKDIPDISLYDHLRSTAAVTLCFYDFLKERYSTELDNENRSIVRKVFDSRYEKDQMAILICGDISGIQDFIYQIASHQAAKSLKGRSFMIQLLADACARFFLKELDLPIVNLIYSSGGNFYILAPNTKFIREKINLIHNRINDTLLKTYGGSLYLGVGQSVLTAQDFLHRLNKKWREAIHSAAKNKNLRFFYEMHTNKDFFKPFGPVENVDVCSICGKDCLKDNMIKDRDGDETKSICKTCKNLIDLGSKLKKSQYLIEIHSEKGRFKPLPGIPISYDISSSSFNLTRLGQYQDAMVKIYRFNNTDFLHEKLPGSQLIAYGYKFYGGNHPPMLDSETAATFNDLAGGDQDSLKRLGVLRMDVDNLGLIFQKGFIAESDQEGAGLYSLSRLSTLSSMLDIFFSGYLNRISRAAEYDDQLFIIYSGGDDIFMVGRWNHVVDCAADIRRQFREYCCDNPRITLSGGLALVNKKHPIHRAADLAGAAEHQAKENRITLPEGNVMEKDSFTFLEKTLSWHDFDVAESIKKDLTAIISDKNSRNKGLLVRLRRIYENYQMERSILERNKSLTPEKRAELIQYNKWRWRMVYDLTRYAANNKEHAQIVHNLQQALLSGNRYKDRETLLKIPDFIDVPTRWAELLTR